MILRAKPSRSHRNGSLRWFPGGIAPRNHRARGMRAPGALKTSSHLRQTLAPTHGVPSLGGTSSRRRRCRVPLYAQYIHNIHRVGKEPGTRRNAIYKRLMARTWYRRSSVFCHYPWNPPAKRPAPESAGAKIVGYEPRQLALTNPRQRRTLFRTPRGSRARSRNVNMPSCACSEPVHTGPRYRCVHIKDADRPRGGAR